jgi:hypothetical protein
MAQVHPRQHVLVEVVVHDEHRLRRHGESSALGTGGVRGQVS